MEKSEFIDDLVDRISDFLKSYGRDTSMTVDEVYSEFFRSELRQVLCNKLKDCKIVSITDLKDRLTVEKKYDPITDSYEFRTGLTLVRTVSKLDYQNCTSDPTREIEFKKVMKDLVKDSFIYSLDRKDN